MCKFRSRNQLDKNFLNISKDGGKGGCFPEKNGKQSFTRYSSVFLQRFLNQTAVVLQKLLISNWIFIMGVIYL